MTGVEKSEVVFHWRCSVPDCKARGEDGVPFYKYPVTGGIFCLNHAGKLVDTQEPLKYSITTKVNDGKSKGKVGYDMDRVLYKRKDLW